VSDGNGRVLFCKRVGKFRNIQTVQGGIDDGETIEQAGRRELLEEIGLRPDAYELRASLIDAHRYEWPDWCIEENEHRYIGQEQSFLLATVHLPVEFNLDEHVREFSRVWWGRPEELVKKAWEVKRPGLEAALRGFGLLSS